MPRKSWRRCRLCAGHEGPFSRSGLCPRCLVDMRKANGALSSGNKTTGEKKERAGTQSSGNWNAGDVKRAAGALSSGNQTTGAKKRTAGAQSSGNRNAGDVKRAAGALSSGNKTTGEKKRAAGVRSGRKRATKNLLIVKKPWLEKILSRRKTWEIRGTSTQKRGLIHLGLSGSGGMILGCANLIDCLPLSREEFRARIAKHCIEDCKIVRYRKIYAWVLKDAQRHNPPLRYTHHKGAVTWIKL